MMDSRPRCIVALRDGDLALMDQLAAELVVAGWRVDGCWSAREALHAGTGEPVDLLITALHLVDGRGDVVYWRLAAQHPGLRGQVVVLADLSDGVPVRELPGVALDVPHSAARIQEAIRACRGKLGSAAAE